MSDTAAEALLQKLEPLLRKGLRDDQWPRVRAGVLPWLAARIEAGAGRTPEERAELIDEDIPESVEEDLADLNPSQRFEYGVTAFDRWRLEALSSSTLRMAAEVFADPRRRESLAPPARAAFEELRAIEDRLHAEFPATAKNCSRVLGESKLDALFVQRGGDIVSRRLGRRIK